MEHPELVVTGWLKGTASIFTTPIRLLATFAKCAISRIVVKVYIFVKTVENINKKVNYRIPSQVAKISSIDVCYCNFRHFRHSGTNGTNI